MLLSQNFKSVGSAASSFRGNRDGFVSSRSRNMKKTMEIRASQKEGWRETATSKLEAVGGFLARTLHGGTVHTAAPGKDEVVYKGTATIVKKLELLDLIDQGADLQDDASELFGKRVTIQLVSTEIDPSMSQKLKLGSVLH